MGQYASSRRTKMKGVLFVPKSLLVLLLTVLCLAGCDNNKDVKKTAPVAQEEPDQKDPNDQTDTAAVEAEDEEYGEVLVTFSATNDFMNNYSAFSLGVYDLVADIRIGTDLVSVSVLGLEPSGALDYSLVTPLALSHLSNGNNHLYFGQFTLPAGTIEAVKVTISGTKSEVKIDHHESTLIDAFFTSYGPGDARVFQRSLPAEVKTLVANGIEINDQKVTLLNIEIDKNLTASIDPLGYDNQAVKYTLFTPSIKVTEKTSPLSMSIIQNNIVTLSDAAINLGQPDGVFFSADYTEKTGAVTFYNGKSSRLADISGVAAIDMHGDLSIESTGMSYSVGKAIVTDIGDDQTAMIYRGIASVDADVVSVAGTVQSYKADEQAYAGAYAYSGVVPGINTSTLDIADGHYVELWVNGEDVKVLHKETQTSDQAGLVFHLRSTVAFPPEDILSISTATNSEADMVLNLQEELDCANYVKELPSGNMKSDCQQALKGIKFDKSLSGSFTLHETRKGSEAANDDGSVTVQLAADWSHHYTTQSEFVAALESKVVTDNYRLVAFSAAGEVVGDQFVVGDAIKVILLQPHEILDADNDGWVNSLIDDEADPLGSDKDKNIGLYAGVAGGVGLVAVAAISAYVIKQMRARKLQSAPESPTRSQDGTIQVPDGKDIVDFGLQTEEGGPIALKKNAANEIVAADALDALKQLPFFEEGLEVSERAALLRELPFFTAEGDFVEGAHTKGVSVVEIKKQPKGLSIPLLVDASGKVLNVYELVDEGGQKKARALSFTHRSSDGNFDSSDGKVFKFAPNLAESIVLDQDGKPSSATYVIAENESEALKKTPVSFRSGVITLMNQERLKSVVFEQKFEQNSKLTQSELEKLPLLIQDQIQVEVGENKKVVYNDSSKEYTFSEELLTLDRVVASRFIDQATGISEGKVKGLIKAYEQNIGGVVQPEIEVNWSEGEGWKLKLGTSELLIGQLQFNQDGESKVFEFDSARQLMYLKDGKLMISDLTSDDATQWKSYALGNIHETEGYLASPDLEDVKFFGRSGDEIDSASMISQLSSKGKSYYGAVQARQDLMKIDEDALRVFSASFEEAKKTNVLSESFDEEALIKRENRVRKAQQTVDVLDGDVLNRLFKENASVAKPTQRRKSASF